LTPLRVGNGINTATAPVWQTETSQSKWRGKLVVLEMMMNIFGFMTVNWYVCVLELHVNHDLT
jgi:hypothetical protein